MASPVEDDPPFLEPLPDPWVVRGLATLLLSGFVVALLLASAVSVPETVTSGFVLRPAHGNNPVRTPQAGMVSRVEIVEGQPIVEGGTLFVVRSQAIGERSSELRALEAESEGTREALVLAREKFESERRAEREALLRQRAENDSLERSLDLHRREVELTAEVLGRFQKLADQGFVSRTDLIRHEREANEAELALRTEQSERAAAEARLEQLELRHERRELTRKDSERQLLDQIEQTEIRVAPLVESLARRTGSELTIAATCSGSVVRLEVQAPGSFVQAGEILGEIACENEPLKAHLTLPKTDLALLEPGQSVKLLFDAFPYQRHGVRYATLRWISPASVEVRGDRVFRALADVEDEAIIVNGKPRALKPGMGGAAKIVVGRRRVIAYAFEPLRQLRESMRAGPGG
ncbi:MAG: hypothetical protein CL908_21460 [Deltaproteobacteria bacterium]|nr:hypothetical protein [Deltaproteobacteria bacterium]